MPKIDSDKLMTQSQYNILKEDVVAEQKPTKLDVVNYIYLYHLDEWLLVPEYPDSIQDKMNSNFATTNALGRTAPVFTFSHSGPRDVQIQLHLHRDMVYDLNINYAKWGLDENEDFVEALVRKLQTMALPSIDEAAKAINPPIVAVKMGKDIFIKGVVFGGVSIEYQKPILTDGRYAQVNLNFSIYEIDPYSAESVARLGSFRGMTRTFKEVFNS